MIRLAIAIIVFMLPSIMVGYLILNIYPKISWFLLLTINMILIAGGFLMLRKREQTNLAKEGKTEDSPVFSKIIGFFLLIMTYAGSSFMYEGHKTSFYIDNASDKDITVMVEGGGTFTIKANEYKELSVAVGKTEVEYNGKKRVFDLKGRGKWVWNIDSLNRYIRTNIEYSSSVDLFKDPNRMPDETMPNMEFIKKEFFLAGVDYMFDAPQKITVDRSIFDNEAVSKMVLYRMNDESFLQDEIEQDSTGIEKNTIQEDKPKKSI